MAIFCVNVRSKEFKDTAARMNIHPSSLRFCVYDFLNSAYAKAILESTGEIPFPSDEYIREYFRKGNNDYGIDAIDNWVKNFGRTYGNILRNQVRQALKYVTRASIKTYKDFSGKDITRVVRPILLSKEQTQYFLEKLNLIDSREDGLHINLSLDAFYNALEELDIPREWIAVGEDRISLTDDSFDKVKEVSALKSNIKKQLSIKDELTKLKQYNKPLFSAGSDKKIKEQLKRLGIHPVITNIIMDAIEKESSLKGLTPIAVFNLVTSTLGKDLAQKYNEYLQKPINEALEQHLINYLKPYHVLVLESPIVEKYGVTGIFDILNKIIYLAKAEDRNSITFTEEFAHAYVELMGAWFSKREENQDYTFLYNNIEYTSLYKQVYDQYKDVYKNKNGTPNINKIKKEAIGLALAVAINKKWEDLSQNQEEQGFWEKLKEWFNKLLDIFKDAEYTNIDTLLSKIATEIIQNDYSRLHKVNDEGYKLLDYTDTLAKQTAKDGGLAVSFMRYFSDLGNTITGSLAYRKQGSVYRGSLDALHDIDMIVPPSAHNLQLDNPVLLNAARNSRTPDLLNYLKETPYFKEIQAHYPNFRMLAAYADKKTNSVTVNAIYCEDDSITDRFAESSGSYADRLSNFTEEERSKIYLFDFFLKDNEAPYIEDTENKLKLNAWLVPIAAKLQMGRAKDIYDYQMWELFDQYKNDVLSDDEYLMFQKDIVWNHEQEAAIATGLDYLNTPTKTDGPAFMLIDGKAGTGKTTVVNEILKRYKDARGLSPKVYVTSTAGKAVDIIKGKTPLAEDNGGSLAAAVSYIPINGIWQKNPSKVGKEPIRDADIVIADECSMISDIYYNELMAIIEDERKNGHDIKLFFLGDSGLLGPVLDLANREDEYKSSNLALPFIQKKRKFTTASLVQRVRLGEDSPIHALADLFWGFNVRKTPEVTSIAKIKSSQIGEGVLKMIKSTSNSIQKNILDELIPKFKEGFDNKDINRIKVVTYHHKKKNLWNKAIYDLLHPENKDERMPFFEGDFIIFNKSMSSEGNTLEADNIYNSYETVILETEDVKEIKFDKVAELKKALGYKEKNQPVLDFNDKPLDSIYVQRVKIKLSDGTEDWVTLPLPDPKNIENVKAAQYRANKLLYDKESKVYKYSNGIFPIVSDSILIDLDTEAKQKELASLAYLVIDIMSPILKVGDTNLSYAINAHKSLGSTYQDVVVDYDDIYSAKKYHPGDDSYSRAMYTALTRASEGAYVISMLVGSSTPRDNAVKVTSPQTSPKISSTPLLDQIKKEEKKKESWESIQAKWDRIIQDQKDHIELITENGNHFYYYYPSGREYPESRIKLDTSVTSLTNPKGEKSVYDIFLDISSRLGTTADAVGRDWFKRELNKRYPNLNSQQLKKLLETFERFETVIQSKFRGKKFKIVTDEIPVAGSYINENDEKVTFGGTLDMLIYDEDGNYMIFDFKTSRSDINRDSMKLKHYGSQVNFYRVMLENDQEEIRNTCIGLGIFQMEVKYATPKGIKLKSELFAGSTEYTFDNLLIFANGKPIQDTSELLYSAPKPFYNGIKQSIIDITSRDTIMSYFINIDGELRLLSKAIKVLPVSGKEITETSEKDANATVVSNVWDYVAGLSLPEGRLKVPYTPKGLKPLTYYVEGETIYNKNNEEVYSNEETQRTHRNKIFANLAWLNGLAVNVEYNNKNYVVYNDQRIVSGVTGEIMKWGPEHGNRKNILSLAKKEFLDKYNLVEGEPSNESSEHTEAEIPTINTNNAQQTGGFDVNNGTTTQYGVVLTKVLTAKGMRSEYEQWQKDNPNGIVAYKIDTENYNTPAEIGQNHIGNPFSGYTKGFGSDTVQKFLDWIVTGNNFGDEEATEEYRQAIISKILNSPEGTPILYYKELNRPSHATVIGYLINNKLLLLLRVTSFYSEDGKTPITMYRGYALTEDREAVTLEETIGHTAVDYDETLKGALYFTSSREEAQDYANARTDKSPEPPTLENPQGRPINRHYTGDYAKVSQYYIAANAKVEHYADIRDYIKRGKNSSADVIILDKGTAFSDNTEYIVKNPNVIIQLSQQKEIEAEMQAIKEKAIADGTFMKAPNGKPTNLTKRQWLQVRTKNFKKWFGDWENDPANASKVVDENGEPLVVYHHTDNPNLTEFSADYENYFAKDGGTKKAIFFDEEKTGTLDRKYDVAVFLNIRELNEYNETKQQLHDRGTTYRKIVNQSAEKNDIDGGVHMKDFDDNKKEHQSIWIVHNPNLINIIGSLQAPQSDKSITISSTGYRKGDPLKNTDTAYIFTENALANAAALELDDSWVEEGYPKGDKVKTGVSDMKGDNQAGIRASSTGTYGKTNISPNAFGIIVKKYQLDNSGKFIAEEGLFKDTDSDFELFKSLNTDMFKRLDNSGLKKIVFPTEMAKGKAALPLRFAQWLQEQLLNKYGIISTVEENTKKGYNGYGLTIKSVNTQQQPSLQQQTIDFESHFTVSKGEYSQRNKENVTMSDATLAFAVDFTTLGEKATKKYAEALGKYHSFSISNIQGISGVNNNTFVTTGLNDGKRWAETLLIKDKFPDGIKLNIAGNGIYTLVKDNISQEDINEYIKGFLFGVQQAGVKIIEVRSGGLTGADEAGIIAAQRLGLPWTVHAPVNWAFRNVQNKDVKNKEEFMKRFIPTNILILQQPAELKLSLEEYDKRENELLALKLSSMQPITDPKNAADIYTLGEIKLILEREDLHKSSLFTPTELNHWAALSIFALSDLISDIQQNKDSNKKYFRLGIFDSYQTFIDTDFTKMSRIEIIDTIGLNNLFTIVKNLYFNLANNPNRLNIRYSTSKKISVINKNFNAFKEMAYATLALVENVGITNENLTLIDNSGLEIVGVETAEESAELFGSAVESWQIGFRLISAVNSLSQLLKRYLSTLKEIDSNGQPITNETGLFERIDSLSAAVNILQWTLHCHTLSEMIEALKEHTNEATWIQQLLDKLNSDDQTFKSLFYSNFRKYFQPYIIQYEEREYNPLTGLYESTGRLMHKVINEQSLERELLDDYVSRWLNRHNEDMMLFNKKDGKINTASLNSLKIALKTISDFVNSPEFINSTDSDLPNLSKDVLQAILNAYAVFDVTSDSINLDKFKIKENLSKLNTALTHIYKSLDKNKNSTDYNIAEGERTRMLDLFSLITDKDKFALESVSYEAGKLHYSYVTPSYMNNLMDKLLGYTDDYDKFLEDEYGFSWFRVKGESGEVYWRNEWLRQLATDVSMRDAIKHAVVLSSKGIDYRNKSPLLYEISMLQNYFYSDDLKTQTVEFENEEGKKVTKKVTVRKPGKLAYYHVPIESNKPAEEYIRFIKYTEGLHTDDPKYKRILVELLMKVAELEIDRIATVLKRINSNTPDLIKNLETGPKKGLKFNFIDYLQPYLDKYNEWKSFEENKSKDNYKFMMTSGNDDLYLGKLIADKINGVDLKSLGLDKNYKELLGKAIRKGMNEKFAEYLNSMQRRGLLDTTINPNTGAVTYDNLQGLNLGDNELTIIENLENFFWNDTFASINILQLTITDIAFYKNAEDLLKRLAQIHAPGLRANLEAKNWKTDLLVTDGVLRTVYILDFDKVVADAIENIKGIFKKRVERLRETDPEEAERFELVAAGIIESYEGFSLTDGQAYNSITSYRKKAIMFGRWNDDYEETYQRIRKGTYNTKDIEFMMQPLKPFVYSYSRKDTGVDGPISEFKVGLQNKNSEYMLLMMDAIILGENGENAAKNSMLSAIYKVMEESHYDALGNYKPDGIDAIQFTSTVKTGESSSVSLAGIYDNIEENTINTLRNAIYLNGNRELGYNKNVVQHLRFEDYCLLTELPPHFEGESIFGSQSRIISIANMPETINGEDLYITFRKNKISIANFKKLYMQAIADNIKLGFEQLVDELGLRSESTKERNIKLSRLLQEEILKDSRFGYDLLYAVSTDINGQFNIPLSDPILAGRIQLLLYSVIKSRINKQQIPGGPIVQVTNFGTSKHLEIVYKDSEGKILPTFREFYNEHERDLWEISFDEFLTYEKYKESKDEDERGLYEDVYAPIAEKYQKEVVSKQAAVAHYQAFAPAALYRSKFPMAVDENGNIDISKIPEDCLEIIAYRIPTEAKYSMFPIKIVGFLPSEAGEVIMMPDSVTITSGTDFDSDKMFTILPDTISVTDYETAFADFKNFRNRKENRKLLDKKKIWEDIFETYPELEESIKKVQEELYLSYKKDHPNLTKEEFLRQAKQNGLKKKTDWIANKLELVDKFLDKVGESEYIILEGNKITFKEWFKERRDKYITQLKITEWMPKKGLKEQPDFITRKINNNIIFDTIYASLTSPLSIELMFVPGNFDEPKHYGYLAEYMRLHPDADYEVAKNKKTEELADAIASNKNLVYNHTHLDFFELNMVAGKLIGIFAQNNISHSIVAMIDGRRIPNTEKGIYYPEIAVDEQLIIEGVPMYNQYSNDPKDSSVLIPFDRLQNKYGLSISSVLASFLAASVDAVKDPVLNYMNINEITAGIHTTLIRMGYDVEFAMLFLTLPVIRDLIAKYKIESENSGISLGAYINNKIEQIKQGYENLDAEGTLVPEISKEILIKSLNKNDEVQVLITLLKALKALHNMSYATSNIVTITKYNSVTAAMGPLISDAILAEFNLNNAISDNRFGTAIREALKNPILTSFLQCSINLSKVIFGGVMPLASTEFRDLLTMLDSRIRKRIDTSIINKLGDFYQAFLLTSTNKPIFKTDEVTDPHSFKRRNDVVTNLPNTIATLKKQYPNNTFLQRLKVKPKDSSHSTRWIELNTRGMKGDVIDQVGLEWEEFYNENPKIAMKLIEYNFYLGGFGFSPKTFNNVVNVALRKIIPNYVDLLNEHKSGIDPEVLLDLFFRNYHNDTTLVPRIYSNEVWYQDDKGKKRKAINSGATGIITVDTNHIRRLSLSDGFVQFFKFNNKLYKLRSGNKFNNIATYEEVSPLGGLKNEILEVSANPNDVTKSIFKSSKEDSNTKDVNLNKDNILVPNSKINNRPNKLMLSQKILIYMMKGIKEDLFKKTIEPLRETIKDKTHSEEEKQKIIIKDSKEIITNIGNNNSNSKKSFNNAITDDNLFNAVTSAMKLLNKYGEDTIRKMANDITTTLDELNLCK